MILLPASAIKIENGSVKRGVNFYIEGGTHYPLMAPVATITILIVKKDQPIIRCYCTVDLRKLMRRGVIATKLLYRTLVNTEKNKNRFSILLSGDNQFNSLLALVVLERNPHLHIQLSGNRKDINLFGRLKIDGFKKMFLGFTYSDDRWSRAEPKDFFTYRAQP